MYCNLCNRAKRANDAAEDKDPGVVAAVSSLYCICPRSLEATAERLKQTEQMSPLPFWTCHTIALQVHKTSQ